MAAGIILCCILITISPWTIHAQSDGDVRLMGGSSASEGRVEIYHNGEWGTVCDDYWDEVDASVVCEQLGYNRAQRAVDQAYFGQGSGVIWLDNVDCSGGEDRLTQCYHRGWGIEDCSHSEDAGAICTNTPPTNGDIRLSDGLRLQEGRVEIYYNGVWGTICDDYWGYDEARVACYQLGWPGVTDSETSYGSGSGPIYMDDVFCYGYESALIYCSFDLNTGDCSHSEDVGIRCYRSGSELSAWAIAVIVVSSIFGFGILVLLISRFCSSSKKRRQQRRPTTSNDVGQSNTAFTTGGDVTITTTGLNPSYQNGVQPYPPPMAYPAAPPPSYSSIAGTPYPPAATTAPQANPQDPVYFSTIPDATPYPPGTQTAPQAEPQAPVFNASAAYPPAVTNQAADAGPPTQQVEIPTKN